VPNIRASITQEESSFLTKIMQFISDNWWQNMVLSALIQRQSEMVTTYETH